ncbi:MAG: hypothetical protein WCX48_10460 [Bacteroidales bacterium]
MKILLQIFLALWLPANAFSATIWCNPANSGAEDGLAKISGYSTLWEAMAVMSSGDTVIIADGDWRNTAGMYIDGTYSPPDGSVGSYTNITAENDWSVKIPYVFTGTGFSYVKFQGIVFDNTYITVVGAGHVVYECDHTKFIRCGFLAVGITGNNHTCGFGSSDNTRSLNQYNLMEECIAWGSGRYVFYSKYGQYNIFRRCVARHDKHDSTDDLQDSGQIANFRAYACNYHVYQNCISIDTDRTQYYMGTDQQYDGPLNSETSGYWVGDQYGATGNIITGSISIKDMQQSFYMSGQFETDVNYISNSSAVDLSVAGGATLSGLFVKNGSSFTNVAGANLLGINATISNENGFLEKNDGYFTVTDSIVSSVANYGLYGGDITATYINYYSIGLGVIGTTWGTGSFEADPETIGLLYPVRIESGSTLATAGSTGGVVGPTILKQIGVSGTLYGETGWDAVTESNLWPFPNEAIIKTLMSTTVVGVSGEYGFTTGTSLDGSAQTLTKYIWEYLGNQIPADIYGLTVSYKRPSLGGKLPSVGGKTPALAH